MDNVSVFQFKRNRNVFWSYIRMYHCTTNLSECIITAAARNASETTKTNKFFIARINLMVVFLLFSEALFAQHVGALCPPRCICNEDSLNVACVDASLDLVPILLNPELIKLNLTRNKITNLHYTLSFYNNLNILDLSYNKIQTLGSMNFESQFQLNQLNISNNFIRNISRDSFKGLKQLRNLDLSYNSITNIMMNAFNDFKSLQIFYLNNNNLVSFEPDLFQHTIELRELYLNNNQILEIPTNIFIYTKQLEYLDLSNNLIEIIDETAITNLPKLKILKLNSNLITNISLIAFDQLPAMQYLDLSDNNIYLVPTQQLSKLTNLTILNLSGNLIVSIDSLAFRSLFQLSTLYLNRLNHLIQIDSRAFVDNVHLEYIHLDSNNKLTTIPTRIFHGNLHIKYISIRNNQFEILQPDHFPLDQLKMLKLSGDNYHCNCSLLWLWRLLNDQQMNSTANEPAMSVTSDFHLDGYFIKCSLPIEYKQMALYNVRESDISCTNNLKTIVTALLLLIFVITVLFSFITYKNRFKCLPFYDQNESTNTNRHIRHNVDISGPSLIISNTSGDHHQSSAMFYDRNHHIQHPQWDISYQEQYSATSHHPIIKQKSPHIVFV